MRRDALGRARRPGQERGLRPMHPPLPSSLESRSIRVAMSHFAWRMLDQLVDRSGAATRPRAVGEIVERALSAQREADWQQWQITKERRLLEAS